MKKKAVMALATALMVFVATTVKVDALSPKIEVTTGSVIEQANSTSYEPIGIKDLGVYPLIKDGRVRIFYAVQIENTNKNLAVEYPHVQVTISAKDGSIIKVEDMVLNGIAPDDCYWFADYFTYEFDGTLPDRADVKVWADDDNYVAPTGELVRSEELVISNGSRRGKGSDIYYTGQVTNNSSKDIWVRVAVIYQKKDQDGKEKPIGADYTFVENLAAGETRAFEIHPFSGIDSYSSAVLYAIQW